PALAGQLRSLSPNEIAARLRAPGDDDWRAFAERWREFIDEFGFRGQGEVDPSYADWEEEPAYALSTVKAFLDAPEERSPYRLEAAAAAQREAIEANLAAQVPAEHQAEYRRLLEGAQTFA